MTTSSAPRRFAARAVALTGSLVLLFSLAGLAPAAADRAPVTPPPNGSLNGDSQDGDQIPSTNTPGSITIIPGTRSCPTVLDGSGKLNGVDTYAYTPGCDPTIIYTPGNLTHGISQCVTGIGVWRFAGTEADPAQALSFSVINAPDVCVGRANFPWRVFPADPHDAGWSPSPRAKTIWNVGNTDPRPVGNSVPAGQQTANVSLIGNKPLYGSPTCIRPNWSHILLASSALAENCQLTTGPPKFRLGKSCTAVQPPADQSIAGWLASTDPVRKAYAQRLLYTLERDYEKHQTPAIAQSLAGLPATAVKAMPLATPDQITATDGINCSSVSDFVKLPIVQGAVDPNQRRLSVCTASILENGFTVAGSHRPLRYLYDAPMLGGQIRPMWGEYAPPISLESSYLRGIITTLSPLQKARNGHPAIRARLMSGVRASLAAWDRSDDQANRPGGYYKPNAAPAASWQYLRPPSSSYLAIDGPDGAMATLNDPLWKGLACYSSVVVGPATPTGGPDPDPTPQPTPPAPTPTRPDPPRPNVPGAGDGQDTFTPAPSPAGPVRVTIDMPRNLAVRGLYGPYPQVRVSDVALMCGARECNHWANELDPVLLGTNGTLAVRANGNYGIECTRLAAILDRGSSAGCGYATDEPTRGRLDGQALRMVFFSATGPSVRIAPLISGGSASVQYYRTETRTRTVDDGPCDPTYGPYNPQTQSRPLMQPSPDCRKTHVEQYTVVVPDGGPRTVGITIAAADGQPLERQVFGSVGGSGG